MEHLVGPSLLGGRENGYSGAGDCPCQKCSQAQLGVRRRLSQEPGGSQDACRVLDKDSFPLPTMRVSGRVIWSEVERNCLPRRSPSRPCRHLLPGDSQVWPRIPRKEGEGWCLCSWSAGPAQRGQEARTPGIVSCSTAQPQPGRKFCRALSAGYIVEQETGHRGSRAVEQAAPDADPTRGCRDKWKLGQRAKVLRCPGRARLREGWCWGGWCWVVGGRERCPRWPSPPWNPAHRLSFSLY